MTLDNEAMGRQTVALETSPTMSAASGTAPTVLPRPTPLNAAPLATLVIVGAVVVFFVVTMASETMDFALVCANPRLAIATPLASYYRVFTSTFAHGSFPHVLFNCLAFTPMASALERSVGTINFAWLFLVFAHVGYAASAASAYALLLGLGYSRGYHSCAIGMSGVVFALIVCETNVNDVGRRSVFGLFEVPSAWYPTALLFFIQLLVPGVSFLGHAAGMATGYLYVGGYLNFLLLREAHVEMIEQSFACAPIRALPSFVSSNAERGSRPRVDASASSFPWLTSSRTWELPSRVSDATRAFTGRGQKLGGSGSTTGEMAAIVKVNQKDLNTLVEMGFSEHASRRALQECKGDLSRATQVLTDAAANSDDEL